MWLPFAIILNTNSSVLAILKIAECVPSPYSFGLERIARVLNKLSRLNRQRSGFWNAIDMSA